MIFKDKGHSVFISERGPVNVIFPFKNIEFSLKIMHHKNCVPRKIQKYSAGYAFI